MDTRIVVPASEAVENPFAGSRLPSHIVVEGAADGAPDQPYDYAKARIAHEQRLMEGGMTADEAMIAAAQDG